MKKSFRDLLCLGLIGAFYLFSIVKLTMLPMHTPLKNWQFFLLSLAAILFLCLVNTRPGRIVFFCAAGFAVVYILYLLMAGGPVALSEAMEPLVELGDTMIRIGTGYYDETVPYAMLLWSAGLYTLMLAVPVYFLTVPRFRFYWLVIPGLGAFMTVWGMFRYLDRLSFYIFITVVIVSFIHHKYLLYIEKDTERKALPAGTNTLLFFLPVALVVILLASSFSIRNTPLQWPWLDEKINQWYWSLYEKYHVDRYDRFSLAHTGFGDPGRLGGPIYPDNTPIMVVQAPTRVYLRGAVYDEYTGLGWNRSEQMESAEINERGMDISEMRYGWKATGASRGIYNLREYREFLEGKDEDRYISIEGADDIFIFKTRYIYISDTNNGTDFNVYGVNAYPVEPAVYVADPDDYLNFLRLQQMPQILSKMHPEEQMIVRHLNVRTRTLFTPLKTLVPINGLPDYRLMEFSEGTFEADERLAGNSEYYFRYFQPAYGMEAMKRFFSSSYRGVYEDFREANAYFISNLAEYGYVNVEALKQELESLLGVYEELDAYSDEMYARYLQLPETIPARVIDLARRITTGNFTTYEKVEALAEYLRKNYTYTMQPGIPPTDQDFVDYFLFDGQEGYCSYFASALCILTRAAGIPARYVEGFVMPENRDKNGFYHVTNQFAHAWTEVYLEGVGWITMEPTPPYDGVMNYYVSLVEATGDPYYYEEMPPEIPDQYMYRPGQIPVQIDIPVNTPKKITSMVILIWAGLALLGIMVLNLLVTLAKRLILQWMKPQKSVPRLYRRAVALLRQAGCDIRPGETPKDFAKRVDERFQLTHMSMSEMADIFYRVRFGAQTPDRKTMKKLISFVSEVKAKSGRALYLHKRLLLRGLLFRG